MLMNEWIRSPSPSCPDDARSSSPESIAEDGGSKSARRIKPSTSTRGSGNTATKGTIAREASNDERTMSSRREGWRQSSIAKTTTLRKSPVERAASNRMRLTRSSHTHMAKAPSR